ncbi:MAG: NADH-quinone oxidoreductase subunit J [Bacillota bacterium]|nr:NADH-quinone oxidoreductase subunit J [Bacillota bacterium]
MATIIYISLAFLLIFCVMAVMSHSLLKSAIYLALASATLGVILYVLGAYWAAVIEVSVCSGLITVIFISAISLSKIKKEEVQKLYSDKKRMWFLPVMLIVVGVALIVLALANDLSLTNTAEKVTEDFREIFWNTRQADIIGQIVTILIGGIAVFVLFRDDEDKK